jgi:hypothetical protein
MHNNGTMVRFRKSYASIVIALALLMVFAGLAHQPTSNATETSTQANTMVIHEIVLANKPEIFNCYNTNGSPPSLNGASALFYGSDKTNVYSDIVSFSSITAEKSLVLQAQVTVNMTSFSDTGEDQFAVFATDDTVKYKSDEFGFVLPENTNTWYAYVQSPKMQGFFAWHSIVSVGTNQTEQHNFKAVYSNDGLRRQVDFYVDGKLSWKTPYPEVSSQSFHMVLTSHKVSAENIDVSQNYMLVEKAVFSDRAVSGSQGSAYQGLVLFAWVPVLPVVLKSQRAVPRR